MNFNKIALVTGLAISGITVSSVFAPAKAAVLLAFFGVFSRRKLRK